MWKCQHMWGTDQAVSSTPPMHWLSDLHFTTGPCAITKMCRTEGAGSRSHFSSVYSLPSLSISFPSRRMHAFFSNKPTNKQVYSYTSNVLNHLGNCCDRNKCLQSKCLHTNYTKNGSSWAISGSDQRVFYCLCLILS